ncbi:Piso0_002886 [Millerozyma farinosa CBS 7064]|uniref:Piso0_002886 protein n=1 Tax=Pichia sorbitophila (strain ATCC MYA-4447 / BCRC 22081 / CBS 7064 / NBRC 10061 / NRRL Y-12695) TaxID=559304 RepID=G8YGK8_PICSO|nr:Piso0_002886 [Millerozyma farinosa CBS 7064]CCE80560.1 Piso0_002886 [Millerozyma farinosa CBS 7064]
MKSNALSLVSFFSTVFAATLTVTMTRSSNSIGAVTSSTTVMGSITGCHFHGTIQYCLDASGVEGSISPTPSSTKHAAQSYTGCHSHGAQTYCLDNLGEEVLFAVEGTEDESEEDNSSSNSTGGSNCHFHAGVEHCVGENESEESSGSCERVDRNYNIPLRVGLLFVILVTSALGSFGPILVAKLFNFDTDGIIIAILKQFGTGVIISTAFVHLMTHAGLMWGNDCINLSYESTATAITMAGIFITFLIEYIVFRITSFRPSKTLEHEDGTSAMGKDNNIVSERSLSMDNKIANENICYPSDSVRCSLLEVGIVFHSILIGITLVVAGDSFFITLFIVIVFHQFFEGVSLGSRIVEMKRVKLWVKLVMALIYAIVTPLGMAIGIGVIHKFNGNDPSTIIALGTLDSFSAGILIWTGLVEMLFHDWFIGPLKNASMAKTTMSMTALIAGIALMSLLGKWA